MKISLFSPYGSEGSEVGLMFLLGAYLKFLGHQVSVLMCDGTVETCTRDFAKGWDRTLGACSDCIAEQRALIAWGDFEPETLSSFLEPEEVEQTRRWIPGLPVEGLLEAEYRGIRLRETVRASMQARVGVGAPDPSNPAHLELFRTLLVDAMQAYLAFKNFFTAGAPDVFIVPDIDDYLIRAAIDQAVLERRSVVRIRGDAASRTTTIVHPDSKTMLTCDWIFGDLSSMRRDCSTWPKEMLHLLKEVLSFLGITEPPARLAEGA